MTAEPITFAMAVASLQAIAKADIRNVPARLPDPFRCHRCLDLGWVGDWAAWPIGWAWQRVQPVPRKACPECGGGAP